MNKRANTGFIGKNKYKKTDNQPDITGNGEYQGVKFRIAGWHKSGDWGQGYSLTFSEIQEKTDGESKPAAAAPEGKAVLDDDMIPF